MKIQKTIDLNIKKQGKHLYIGDLPTLLMVMGTSSVQGNLGLYGIEKISTPSFKGYKVEIQKVKERIEHMQDRIRIMTFRLEIMNQIVTTNNKPCKPSQKKARKVR